MQPSDDNRIAFLRWRNTGDLAALTAVFDRLGQELLLVASHVATAGMQPEDLLQDTFLTAIEKADRFDGIRPLEPWLLGILVNAARRGRRQMHRERTGLDVGGDFVLADPAAHAATEELATAVREAIGTLPLPQREVMTLHLVHGMTPTEIAHATARPVGTVKSWIHRSLERVRSLLPVGLAAPFALLLRGMQRIGEVRAAVLAAGATSGAVTGAATDAADATEATRATTAVRSLARTMAWLAGTACAVLGVLWSTTRGDAAPPIASTPASAPAAQVVALDTGTSDRVGAEPGEPAATAAGAPTCTLTIVGRPAGEPFAFSGYVVSVFAPDPYLQRVPFTTGILGVHTFHGVPFSTYLVQPDRARAVPAQLDRAQVTVEVPIARGHDVHGRVVDGNGRGVAEASVSLSSVEALEDRQPVATTDANGAFVVRAVPAGHYLSAERAGWLTSRLVAVPADAPETVALELRLDEAATTIAFEVVDSNGAAVANAMLQLGHGLPRSAAGVARLASLQPAWRGRTDATGRAVCAVARAGVPTTLFARGPYTAPVECTVVAQPGGAPQRLVLARGGSVRGRLREPETPPRHVTVRALGQGLTAAPTTPVWCLPSCNTTTDGAFQLFGIPAGRAIVRVVAGDDLAERTFDVLDGETIEWSPRLGASGELCGRVEGLDGRTASTLRVKLRSATLPSRDADVAADGTFRFGSVRTRDYELLLLPRSKETDLVLQRRYPVRSGDDVRLTLPRELTPLGQVRGVASDAALRLLSLNGSRGSWTVEAGDDGAFAFDAVPAGTWQLLAGRMGARWHRELQVAAGATVDLGTITAEPTTPVTLTVDGASDREPLEVNVRSTDATTMLTSASHHGQPLPLELPQGRWQFELWRKDCCVAATVVAVAGEPLAVTLSPPRGEAVVLTATSAQPAFAQRVIWTVTGPGGRRHYCTRGTDGFGHCSIGLHLVLPAGEHEVAASSGDGPVSTMRFTIPIPTGQLLPALMLK